jgi:hypothetical protein
VFLTSVLGGIVAALLVGGIARLLERARVGMPRVLGFVKLSYVRAATAGVFGIAMSNAVSLSESGSHHKALTYWLWYGGAGAALLVTIILTVIIDRRSERAAPDSRELENNDERIRRVVQEERAKHAKGVATLSNAMRRAAADPSSADPAAPAPGRQVRSDPQSVPVEVRKRAVKLITVDGLLSDLRATLDAGQAILEPIDRPKYAMDSGTGWALERGQIEQKVRSWAQAARERLMETNYVRRFDEGPDLPTPSPFTGYVGTTSTSPEQLAAFMRAKTANLKVIIGAIEKER